jgi:hypothetical protein
MSEQPIQTPNIDGQTFQWPQGIEWLWWALLILSLITGFGLTIFAPT